MYSKYGTWGTFENDGTSQGSRWLEGAHLSRVDQHYVCLLSVKVFAFSQGVWQKYRQTLHPFMITAGQDTYNMRCTCGIFSRDFCTYIYGARTVSLVGNFSFIRRTYNILGRGFSTSSRLYTGYM